jgi:5S rRNA maturation endonuclease (ribonuclease M5)
MKRALIITEGKQDAEILKKVLPVEILDKIKILSGGNSALSLARTVLVTKQVPTVLLVDADSNNENKIIEKQNDLTDSLNSVSIGTEFKVYLMTPEIEVLFLENPSFLEDISSENRKFTPFEIELAKSNPKKFLREIVSQTDSNNLFQNLFSKLDAETVEAMKNHKTIKDLTEFLTVVLDESQPSLLALEK